MVEHGARTLRCDLAENQNGTGHARRLLIEAFDARNKRPVVTNTAIVRELAGWRWSRAVLET